ncbi:MAG: glycosyltransferase, partial [Chloroflexota bacterium]
RKVLGIPDTDFVLMFGAQNLSDSRKGGDLLIRALQQLPKRIKKKTALLIMGSNHVALAETVEMPAVTLGFVESDRLKSAAFSAADLFIFPTRADNLPLILQECLACGTPMVSMDVGGVSDLVRPGVTGLLADPEDATGLADNIVQLLDDNQLRQQMAESCRQIALDEYSSVLQAERYMKLYQQLLN